VEEEAIFVQSK